MTKYEYKHNREHKKIYVRKGDHYVTPIERIVIICLINIILLIEPFVFAFAHWYVGLILFLIMASMFLWSEYNVFYNLERIEYFFYVLLGKENVYKRLIIELSQYENVVKYEQKLDLKLRKSYYNCKKVVFSSQKYKGYLSQKFIKINGETIAYNINDFNKIGDYINFVKLCKKQ